MSDLVERLLAPAYWLSGSSDGHEGENDAPLEAAARITEIEAENARLRDNAKANNMLARHETAGRKDHAMRRAMLANALEALCDAVERGDATAQDVADCRSILARAALAQGEG